MAKKTILCLMDYGKECRTGFATVSKNVKRELRKAFGEDLELHILAVNHFGDNYTEEDGTIVLGAKRNDVRSDDFGRFAFLKILHDSDAYDGIFIIQDLGVIVPIIEILQSIKDKKKKEGKKQFKSVWYFPVDCRIFPTLVKSIEFFDLLVTYTYFGRDEVLRLRPDLKGKIKVVYHGHNDKDFYPLPLEDRLKFKKEYFGDNAEKIIIGNINRNQPRKDIINTIFGFIEAKAEWERCKLENQLFLYLHCHPLDPMGHDIRAVLNQTELVEGKDYQLISKELEENLASIETLNNIYNAIDIYITTTLGEGWGLTITEAMATKKPIIAPLSTSINEILGGGTRGYLLETIVPYCSNNDNIIREQTDYIEVGEKMVQVAQHLIHDNKELKEKIENAHHWINTLNWKDVCKQWVEYFKKVF